MSLGNQMLANAAMKTIEKSFGISVPDMMESVKSVVETLEAARRALDELNRQQGLIIAQNARILAALNVTDDPALAPSSQED